MQKYKSLKFIRTAFFLQAICLPLIVNAADDSDSDNIPDSQDNCINVANTNQRDTDNDKYGNLCDGDLNNDGQTNTLDLNLYRIAHRSNSGDANFNRHADFNGDNKINTLDLNIYRVLHRSPPGPSGTLSGENGSDISKAEASRFLTQTTFGPKFEDIDNLVSLDSYETWIDEQFNTSPSLLLPTAKSIYQKYHQYCLSSSRGYCPPSLTEILTSGQDDSFDTGIDQFRTVWWSNAIDGKDQLRQRIAFALSEILVVSDIPDTLNSSAFAVADYYDTLTRHSFGNYRELLEAITLHPVMGIYLSHVQNEKADSQRNIRPDENFARELLQLFSIGVHELNNNGIPKVDAAGKSIPAYGQLEVQEFARVFTGWYYAGIDWGKWHQRADKTRPMVAHEEHHDTGQKQLLNGQLLAAGQTARQDLEAALDNIFNHPNVGPFVSKLLIQRLVTSNPTPSYVSRVASIFNNNGQGVRGDMKAVIKAIFLDTEARTGINNVPDFGKLREPLLRITHLWRAFDAVKIDGAGYDIPPGVKVYSSPGSWSGLRFFEQDIAQNVLRSPSVFNFFKPNFSPQGIVQDEGLVAPEFEIATENTIMAMTNTINWHIQNAETSNKDFSYLRLDNEINLAANPDALLDHLDILLMSGGLTDTLRTIIRNHLNDASFTINNFTDEAEQNLAKARDAITLIVNSPEYLIQK